MDPFTNVLTGDFKIKTLIELSTEDYLISTEGKPVKIKSIKFKKSPGIMVRQEIGDTLLLSKGTKFRNCKIKLKFEDKINYANYRKALKGEYSSDIVSTAAAIIDSAYFSKGIYFIEIKNLEPAITAIRAVGMVARYKNPILYFTGNPSITTLLPRKNNIIREYYNIEVKDIDEIDSLEIELESPTEILLEDFTPVLL